MISLAAYYVPCYMQLHFTKVAFMIFAMAFPIAANRLDTKLNPKGCGVSEPMGRIYNGKPIGRENVPWMVSVLVTFDDSGKVYQCGGSIITSNVILTAGHCLYEEFVYAKEVVVVFNSTQKDRGSAMYAEMMMVHPEYSELAEVAHDVGLLKLPLPLEFNPIVKPVCLPTAKMELAGKTLLVAGWGGTENAVTSETLLHAHVVALSDEECEKAKQRYKKKFTFHPYRTGPVICAKLARSSSCRGDSGGPITFTGDDGRSLQVAIVSGGDTLCPPRVPSVHTRVSGYVRWIRGALSHPGKWMKLRFFPYLLTLQKPAHAGAP